MHTLVMARSPDEWVKLERDINAELGYYDELGAAKKEAKQAKAYFRKHATWLPGYDPDVDLVANVTRRGSYSDWRP